MSASRNSLICLLTDFGTSDIYAGVMKGVISGIAPEARIVDLTHDVKRYHVNEAAYALFAGRRYFPTETIFCCVVDPGVGTGRRPVAVEVVDERGRVFVICPDNGLVTPLLPGASRAITLDDPRFHLAEPSATFHGRDIFAPAAAHLAAGVPFSELGSPLVPSRLTRLEWPEAQPEVDGWSAMVIHVDAFGNLITNLPGAALEEGAWYVRLGDHVVDRLVRTFGEVAVGAGAAYVGSSGLLEIAVREGDAGREWQAGVGSRVLVRRRSDSG
jgi:S-adenosylmethionine hydrolase